MKTANNKKTIDTKQKNKLKDLNLACQMYSNGISYSEMAPLFNKPPSTYYLKKQKTPLIHIKKMFCLSGKEDEICQMYQQGLTTYQIAKKFNVSQKSIYNKLKKKNVVLREKGKRYLLESDKEKIISLYKAGYSILALSEKFDCSWVTVKNLLNRENVPKMKPMIKKTPRKSKWVELGPKIEKFFNKGITVRQISQELGASISTIRYYIRLKGLTRNPIFNNRHTFTKSDLVIELYTKNLLSKAKIAKQLRCGVDTISRVLRENNIPTRKILIEGKIKNLYDQGLTYEKIGQKMGMTVSGISHFVKNKGWHRKPVAKVVYHTKTNGEKDFNCQFV